MKVTKTVLVTAGIIIGLGVIIAIWAIISPQKNSPGQQIDTSVFEDQVTGLKLTYPNQFSRDELSEQDTKDKFLLRLSKTSEPVALVSVRYEDGLRIAASASRTDILTLLRNNSHKALPERYPGFELLEEKTQTFGGKEGAELLFTYKGPSGSDVKQRLAIIVIDDDRAAYVSLQGEKISFDQVDADYFSELMNSIRF